MKKVNKIIAIIIITTMMLAVFNISYATSDSNTIVIPSESQSEEPKVSVSEDGKKYGNGNIKIRSDLTGGKRGDNIKLTVSITEEYRSKIISDGEKVEGTIRYSNKIFSDVKITQKDDWKGSATIEDGSQKYPRI